MARRLPGLLLAGLLGLQVLLASGLDARPPALHSGPVPPRVALDVLALGEARLLARWLDLRVQAGNEVTGRRFPLTRLDYHWLTAWLDRALALDPDSGYPLLLAVRLFADVPDRQRSQVMMDFVERAFLANPDRHWRWLAEAALLARHRWHDNPLALHYAELLAQRTDPDRVPGWARQMAALLLADLGEAERARILIGGLLASGAVTDPAERRMLARRLRTLGSGYDGNSPLTGRRAGGVRPSRRSTDK